MTSATASFTNQGATMRLMAVNGEDCLVLRDCDRIFLRRKQYVFSGQSSADGPPLGEIKVVEVPNPTGIADPFTAVAAMVTKWGFDPVNGTEGLEIGNAYFPKLKKVTLPDGSTDFVLDGSGWRRLAVVAVGIAIAASAIFALLWLFVF